MMDEVASWMIMMDVFLLLEDSPSRSAVWLLFLGKKVIVIFRRESG